MSEICFSHGGIALHAVEHGAGRPLVLLHGGLANHTACRVFAAPLDARYRVITPDLRGSGRSIYRAPLDWRSLAGDIAALIRHLGLSRAVVGGISFGSGVAACVAIDHPDVVDALVLLHPAYDGVALTPAQQAAMAAMDAAGRRAPLEGIGVLLPLFDALPEPVRARARALVQTYDPESVAASTAFMASGVQPFTTSELATIAVPTLVVPGVDAYHPPEIAEVFRRQIANCTVRATMDLAAVIAEFIEPCIVGSL